tara:strand:+ start:1777 stop:2001 length:225 start_codon:yes stop_codon:yes gene_type:complete
MKLEELEAEILALVDENKKLILENETLRDENESLWLMLDEIKKADVEEHTHLLKELELQMKLKSLMYTTKKGLA